LNSAAYFLIPIASPCSSTPSLENRGKASGRDTVLAQQLQSKQKNPKHKMAAIYGHFNKVTRRTGKDAGNIGIYWFQHGWIWLIPLNDGMTSIGG
jgi:flavin-dependent dehydrogenase